MTATAFDRHTKSGGPVPISGEYLVDSNTLIHKGQIVTVSSSTGYAGNTVANNAAGVAAHAVNNKTGSSDTGGTAGAVSVLVEFGVKALAYTGTVPKPGNVVFVVDNQTVSLDSDTGARGIAGSCVGIQDSQALVYMGPHVVGLISVEASVAADLDTAEANIDDLQATVALGHVDIPLTSWVVASTGAPLGAYSDGTNGYEFANSESLAIRFNDDTTAAVATSVAMPQDLAETSAVEVHALCSRVGAADVTVVLTFTAFFLVAGSAHTADANCGGNTGAIDSATTVLKEVSLAIAHGDVPAPPAALVLTMVPSSALDDDDLRVHATWIEYTRAI